MTPKDRTGNDEKTTSQSSVRKPYRKPEFRFERVFETTALACGKTAPVQASCRVSGRKSS